MIRRHQALLIAASFMVAVAGLGVFASSAIAQPPPGDFGDAPVGDVADNIQAYPGVLARWVSWYQHRNSVTVPVQHLNGTWLHTGSTFRLGQIPPTPSADTLQQPGAPENDADPIIVLEALGPNPLAQLLVKVSTDAAHDPAQPFYLNVFIDQNRTGEWKDGWYLGSPVIAWDLEWVVQDLPIQMPADEVRDVSFGYIRLADPTQSVWLRLVVSDAPVGTILKAGEPFWDATMNASHGWNGEIEDHLLDYQTVYQPGKGIYPWWVFGRGGGGGGGNPKPACDAFYVAPKVLLTPLCADGQVFFNPTYRVTERQDGCDQGLLWGMYGLKHLAGIISPPIVTLNPAGPGFFEPGTLGDNTLTCDDGTVLTLPAAVQGFGPMFQGHVSAATLRGGTVPPAFAACYPAPKRFRAYRAFLEVMSCGSVHQSVAVRTGPPQAHTPSAIQAIGQRVDHVDFIIGDLVEAFLDLEYERPFPDPDFEDYSIWPPAGGELDEETFVSAPASLRLQGAIYSVRPSLPTVVPMRATRVDLSYQTAPGTLGLVTATNTAGDVFSADLPEADTWLPFTLSLPEEFELDMVEIELEDGWLDDLVVSLDGIDDCNGNGVHDPVDIYNGTSLDLDGNGAPDECDLISPCEGYCGTRSPDGCWCDEHCEEYGDCCDDVDPLCAEVVTGVNGGVAPSSLAIADVAPNPFNPMTTISFDLPQADEVTLAVYDVRGSLVRTLWHGHRDSGRHVVTWNGRDSVGRAVPSGVYLVRVITSGGAWRVVKVTLAR